MQKLLGDGFFLLGVGYAGGVHQHAFLDHPLFPLLLAFEVALQILLVSLLYVLSLLVELPQLFLESFAFGLLAIQESLADHFHFSVQVFG